MPRTTYLIVLLATAFGLGCATAKRAPALPPGGSYNLVIPPPGYFCRQGGRLDVSRNDSAQRMIYKTDTSEMTTGLRDTLEARLVTLLFQNGLLTPELLSKAINDYKIVDHRGDTTAPRRSVNTGETRLQHVQRISSPTGVRNSKKTMTLGIRVSFKHYRELPRLGKVEWPAYCHFELTLQGKHNPDTDLAAYLREASIVQLWYTGTEI